MPKHDSPKPRPRPPRTQRLLRKLAEAQPVTVGAMALAQPCRCSSCFDEGDFGKFWASQREPAKDADLFRSDLEREH